MATLIGVWIEHPSARVVTLRNGDQPVLTRIETEVPPQHKGMHEGHPRVGPGNEHVPGPHGKDDRFRQSMIERHYARVMDTLRGADHIAVYGHGPTLKEFEKAVRADRELGPKVHSATPADRLTDAQFIASVREVFGAAPARQYPNRQHP